MSAHPRDRNWKLGQPVSDELFRELVECAQYQPAMCYFVGSDAESIIVNYGKLFGYQRKFATSAEALAAFLKNTSQEESTAAGLLFERIFRALGEWKE